MKKIGISTLHTGYNYGSALQAFATKSLLSEMGYQGEILTLKGSLVKGRDVRLKKMVSMTFRVMISRKEVSNKVNAYGASLKKEYSQKTQCHFEHFTREYIKPHYSSWQEMKRIGKHEDYVAFLCGSDQIWSGDTLYVDPQYYLRYAPEQKRIAFAPSFGKDAVTEFNKKKISRYINEIPQLSVREASAVKLIKELTGRDANQLLDPTLLLTNEEWDYNLHLEKEISTENSYVLAYFLNEPSENAKRALHHLANTENLRIVAIPSNHDKADWFDETKDAGPREFVELVKNASFICTDSFHGTTFSIIYRKNFYTFNRNYGQGINQSTRLTSLLTLLSLESRFDPNIEAFEKEVDYRVASKVLVVEQESAKRYLVNSIQTVEGIIDGR